jgi:hypothetical protein
MAGKAAPKLIRQRRHQFAAELLAKGTPFSTVVARVASDWGCSRRQARNVVNQALAEVVGDLDTVDVKALLADTLTRLQRIAQRAEQCEQFGAAVGALRSLHEFAVEPSRSGRQGHAHGRSRHHA